MNIRGLYKPTDATRHSKKELDEMMAANIKMLNEQEEAKRNATLPEIKDTFTKSSESEKIEKQQEKTFTQMPKDMVYNDENGKVFYKEAPQPLSEFDSEMILEREKAELEDIELPKAM